MSTCRCYVYLSDNDVFMSDLCVDLSVIMSTCQMQCHLHGMVAYICHHLSDNYMLICQILMSSCQIFYVDLSDLYMDLSDLYVDLSLKDLTSPHKDLTRRHKDLTS